MADVNYVMITVAGCEPSYLETALEHVGGFAGDLRERAGAITTRYGVVATGETAGSLVLFQGYHELNGIDAAFKVYAESADYQALMSSGKIKVHLRNISKLERIGLSEPSSAMPAYGVTTRWASADLMLDRIEKFIPIFERNGAMLFRYGTLVTGSHAGKRLLGVTYPSMDAIEKTYTALRATDEYAQMLGDVSLEMRNIVRIVG